MMIGMRQKFSNIQNPVSAGFCYVVFRYQKDETIVAAYFKTYAQLVHSFQIVAPCEQGQFIFFIFLSSFQNKRHDGFAPTSAFPIVN